MMAGPDGNIWFSETDGNKIGRITLDGKVTEFGAGISPGARPLSIAVARWRAVVQRSRRLADRPASRMDGVVTGFQSPAMTASRAR